MPDFWGGCQSSPTASPFLSRSQAVDKGRQRRSLPSPERLRAGRSRRSEAQRMGTEYDSPLCSLRSCWTAFLNSLRGIPIRLDTMRTDPFGKQHRVYQQPVRDEGAFRPETARYGLPKRGVRQKCLLGRRWSSFHYYGRFDRKAVELHTSFQIHGTAWPRF